MSFLLLGLLLVVPLVPNPGLFTNADAPKWAVLCLGLLAALLLVILRAGASGEDVKVGLPEHLALLALLVVAGMLLGKRAPDSRATVRTWAIIGSLTTFGILASRYLRDGHRAERAFLVSLGAGAIGALIGVAGIGTGILAGPGSTFGNPSFAAEYCAPLVPVAAALFLMGRRAPALLLLLPLLVFLVVSKSRADWLGLLVAGAVLLYFEVASRRSFRPRPRTITAVLLVGVLALPYLIQILPLPLLGRGDTVRVRELTRASTAEMGLAAPMSGVGLGGFEAAYPEVRNPDEFRLSLRRDVSFPHNLPLSVFAETGIPGLGFLLLFLWTTISAGVRTLLARPDDGIAFGALGGVVSVLVSAQFSGPLRHPASALLFFLFSALLVARRPRRYVGILRGRYRRVVPLLVMLVGPLVLAVHLSRHLPADHHLASAKARMLELRGGVDEEVAALLVRSTEFEDSPDALRYLAYYHTGTKNPRRALEILDDLFALSPRHHHGRIEQARAYLADGQPDAAIEVLDELVPQRPGDDVVLSLRARARSDRDDLPGAYRDYLEAIRSAPLSVVPEYVEALQTWLPAHASELSSTAVAIGREDRDRGLAILTTLERLPTLTDADRTQALLHRALVHTAHGELDEAMSLLRAAMGEDRSLRLQLLHHPGLDPLRRRADFRELLR